MVFSVYAIRRTVNAGKLEEKNNDEEEEEEKPARRWGEPRPERSTRREHIFHSGETNYLKITRLALTFDCITALPGVRRTVQRPRLSPRRLLPSPVRFRGRAHI